MHKEKKAFLVACTGWQI